MKKYRNHNDDNFDEHGLLKDGHVYRPPGGLMMMDSDSARDRRIAALIDARHAHGDRGAMRITASLQRRGGVVRERSAPCRMLRGAQAPMRCLSAISRACIGST
jgi:hypothetical protein